LACNMYNLNPLPHSNKRSPLPRSNGNAHSRKRQPYREVGTQNPEPVYRQSGYLLGAGTTHAPMGGPFFACTQPAPLSPPITQDSNPERHRKLKRLITLTIFACSLLTAGCNNAPHRRDLETLYLVYGGRATHKQAFLWFERTTHEALVRKGEYFVSCSPRNVRERRPAREGESVRDVIASVAGIGKEHRHFFFLVRGIGSSEEIIRGYDSDAANLPVAPGDLLIIDPSPTHILFRTPTVHADR
jgi:hypothetical protein